MRPIWSSIALVTLVGCGQSVNFEHQSELSIPTRGVSVVDNQFAHVGMWTTTCRISLSDGLPSDDYDIPPDNEETVVDSGTLNGEPAVLITSNIGAHLVLPGNWERPVADFPSAAVIDGAIYDGGFVTLHGDGVVTWWNDAGVTAVAVPAFGDIAVTRDGLAIVGSAGGVTVVDESGQSTLIEGGDIVVWDEFAGAVYTAATGETSLSAVELDGTVRWTTELPGAIASLDAMGALASAAVMVAHDNGLGELVTVDGFTGEITSTLTTPSAANAVETSADGRSMALVLDNEVHFFKVRGAF